MDRACELRGGSAQKCVGGACPASSKAVGRQCAGGGSPHRRQGKFPHCRSPWPLAAALAVGLIAAKAFPAATHPGLVDPAKAKCTTCHAKVLAAKLKHRPVLEDCRSCHEFGKTDGQTTVQLSTPQPALCVTCHDGLTKSADGSLAAPHAPVVESCDGCHDPHSSVEAHLLKSSVPALCVDCHAAIDLDKEHGVNVSRSDCAGCHAPHGSGTKGMLTAAQQHAPFRERTCQACHRKSVGARVRLQVERGALCFACHSEVEASLANGSVHGAVRQGACVGCHDPHLAGEGKLLKAKGAALCFSCHLDIRARASSKGAHAPVTEGCDACHAPHRSDNPRQLTAKLPDLCLTCHDATDKKLIATHLGADLGKLTCTSCHDPHGSPEKKLLASRSVHQPFREGCTSCHEGAAGKLVENGTKELCFACHGDLQEALGKLKVAHPALAVSECVACHTPHASAQAKLIKAPGGGPCLACHEDKGPGAGEVIHGVMDTIGCTACHEAHGGANSKLLRMTGSALCLGCHDPRNTRAAEGNDTVTLLGRFSVPVTVAKEIRTVRLAADGQHNHPVTGHRTVGAPSKDELGRTTTTFTGELACESCHDPHKGRSRQLFRGGASGGQEVCRQCHKK